MELPHILDNLIAQKRVPPIVLVQVGNDRDAGGRAPGVGQR